MNYADDMGLKVQDEASIDSIVTAWLGAFEAALASGDAGQVASLLTEDSNWRDVLAFTWHLKPQVGAEAIAEGLVARQPAVQARGFGISPQRTPPRRVKRPGAIVSRQFIASRPKPGVVKAC